LNEGKTKPPAKERLVITAPNFQTIELLCRGNAPYVQHKFSARTRGKMMATQQAGAKSKSKTTREPRDFEADYRAAMYVAEDGWYGIPAAAFRNAMISACRCAGYVMTKAKLALKVEADGTDADDGTPLVRITKGEPELWIAPARNDNGGTDLRARPRWDAWELLLRVTFDADMLGPEDIANLVMRAGLQVGVGEGRPDSKKSNGLSFGTWDIVQGAP
jgi:hypothetical protein